jgi:hypothetical protein
MILSTGISEIDNASFPIDFNTVGEPEWNTICFSCNNSCNIFPWMDHHESMVGISNVQIPCFLVELQTQRSTTLVLPAQVLRASAFLQASIARAKKFICNFVSPSVSTMIFRRYLLFALQLMVCISINISICACAN